MAEDKNLEPAESVEQAIDPASLLDDVQAEIDLETPSGDDLMVDSLDGAAEPYEISADETEAEELEGVDLALDVEDEPETDEMISDAEQLKEAEAEAEAAASTRPMKRKQLRKLAQAEGNEGEVVADGAVPSSRPARRSPVKKDAPTRKRDQAVATSEKKKSVGPAQFVRESIAELRKTVWPTGAQMSSYFTVVLTFVLFIIFFVWALDSAFGWALLKALG